MGGSRDKETRFGLKGLRFNFFGFIQWIGDSLAPHSQTKNVGANFCRFRAEKWPISTFFGKDFETFAFSYLFRIFDPTQGLYAWKHYTLRVGWHSLAQNLAKMPK